MSRMVATGCWYVQVAAPTVAMAMGSTALVDAPGSRARLLSSILSACNYRGASLVIAELVVLLFFFLSLLAPPPTERGRALSSRVSLFPAVSARMCAFSLSAWVIALCHYSLLI